VSGRSVTTSGQRRLRSPGVGLHLRRQRRARPRLDPRAGLTQGSRSRRSPGPGRTDTPRGSSSGWPSPSGKSDEHNAHIRRRREPNRGWRNRPDRRRRKRRRRQRCRSPLSGVWAADVPPSLQVRLPGSRRRLRLRGHLLLIRRGPGQLLARAFILSDRSTWIWERRSAAKDGQRQLLNEYRLRTVLSDSIVSNIRYSVM